MKVLTTDKRLGAIWSNYCNESESIIKKLFNNYNSDIFMTKYYTDTQETTYKELVFKDGKLISAIGNPNEAGNNIENNTGNNIENNTGNNIENNIGNDVENNTGNDVENNIGNDVENNTGNDVQNNNGNNIENNTGIDTKLPQTGEDLNVFTEWLSVVIVLGIIWLGSMLLIDREKKKMTKK